MHASACKDHQVIIRDRNNFKSLIKNDSNSFQTVSYHSNIRKAKIFSLDKN